MALFRFMYRTISSVPIRTYKDSQFYDNLIYVKTIKLDPAASKLIGPFESIFKVSSYSEFSKMSPPVFNNEDLKDIELLSEDAFWKYIKMLTLYSKHKFTLPQDFLDLIVKRLEMIPLNIKENEIFNDINCIYEVNPNLHIKEMIYNKISKLSKENLRNWSLLSIANLFKIIVKIYKPGDKLATLNGKDFFTLMQLILPEMLTSNNFSSMDHIVDIITIYLQLGKGSSNFFVAFEKLLLSHLKNINEATFLNIITAYKRRICADHDYAVNKLLIPFTEKTATFISFIRFRHTSRILYALCTIFNRYGSCYSESIEISLKRSMKETYLRMTQSEAATYLLTILSYSSNVRFLDEHFAMLIYNHYRYIYNEIKDEHKVNFAYYFCRFNKIPDHYWEHLADVMRRADSLSLIHQGMLQSTLIKLKNSNPFAQALLYKNLPVGFANEMEVLLQNGRVAFAMKSKKSLEHTLTEEVLEELGVKFTSEYFQIYCIDIAIPEWKIGFEVCGPSHFIWPSGAINGKTLYKQEMLSLLKWKIHIIRFSPSVDLAKRKKEIKKEIYEILTQAKLIVKQSIEF
ncbi:hypothetical protein SteCoe_26948 [Stentor coeruleus]|uniref:RAP domain-containing protein n=1 Tax=Stentor coeruleus TaxID=5963 RepID=A0A1R2BBK9_9CILI|nr:hypothetical protein SteCoe_26948 [Stentor coeruleus]